MGQRGEGREARGEGRGERGEGRWDRGARGERRGERGEGTEGRGNSSRHGRQTRRVLISMLRRTRTTSVLIVAMTASSAVHAATESDRERATRGYEEGEKRGHVVHTGLELHGSLEALHCGDEKVQ